MDPTCANSNPLVSLSYSPSPLFLILFIPFLCAPYSPSWPLHLLRLLFIYWFACWFACWFSSVCSPLLCKCALLSVMVLFFSSFSFVSCFAPDSISFYPHALSSRTSGTSALFYLGFLFNKSICILPKKNLGDLFSHIFHLIYGNLECVLLLRYPSLVISHFWFSCAFDHF